MRSPIHLNALRAFEASARHQSFSKAAAELHVTPAAVGQLVRGLEEWLGMPLFARSASGRTRLVAGLERLKAGAARGVLTVTVSPAFAAKWLLPRFEHFQAACPDTDVRLEVHARSVDFTAQRVDIGVRYGAGVWPGLTAEKLMDEEMYPVCSPALLHQGPPLRAPGDLRRAALIHDLSMDGHAGFPTWETWLRDMGVAGVETARGLRINNSAAVLQAVIEGRGVALARSVMARDDLAAGRVVRLFPQIRFACPLAYYIVYRPENASLPRLAAFRDWLLREAAAPGGFS